MRVRSRYSIQRTMIIYFLLIGFASILLGIEFLADFHGGKLKNEIWAYIQQTGQSAIDQDTLFAPIDRLRSKAILMVVIIMVVMVIVLTMFIKHITEPLQHMIQVSREISAGDLSQAVKIDAKNELAELGNVINEMATNLQEVTLLSQAMCSNGKRIIDDTLDQINETEDLDAEKHNLHGAISKLKNELATLSEVIDQFNFYSVERKSDAG